MASSLLILLDDIATILDDVAVMSKMAAKKTAGVLGDDLALNAQQVSGVRTDRELPVVWAVAKGSFVNKLILVPAACKISLVFAKQVRNNAKVVRKIISAKNIRKMVLKVNCIGDQTWPKGKFTHKKHAYALC
jgi:hypothetical protein